MVNCIVAYKVTSNFGFMVGNEAGCISRSLFICFAFVSLHYYFPETYMKKTLIKLYANNIFQIFKLNLMCYAAGY